MEEMCLDLTDENKSYDDSEPLLVSQFLVCEYESSLVDCLFKDSVNFQIKLMKNPKWCLDAGTPIKPRNPVTIWGCDWTVLGQNWTMQMMDMHDLNGYRISYLVLASPSKKLTGNGPAKKPKHDCKSKGNKS